MHPWMAPLLSLASLILLVSPWRSCSVGFPSVLMLLVPLLLQAFLLCYCGIPAVSGVFDVSGVPDFASAPAGSGLPPSACTPAVPDVPDVAVYPVVHVDVPL